MNALLRAEIPASAEPEKTAKARSAMRASSLVAALLLSLPLWSLTASKVAHGASGDILWQDRIDFGLDDGTTVGVLAADGHALFVVGFVQSTRGDYDVLVRAYDVGTGDIQWQHVFDEAQANDLGFGVSAQGGRVFVSGFSTYQDGSARPFIRAYESRTGDLLWHRTGTAGNTFGPSVILGRRVFVVGGFVTGSANGDWLVHAYDSSTGAPLWEDRFDAGRIDRALTIAAQGDRVLVGGRAESQPTGESMWTVRAYDSESGAVLWEHAVNVPGHAFTVAQVESIHISAGQVTAAGVLLTSTSGQLNSDWLIRSYDAHTGALLWEETVDKGGRFFPEQAFDMAVVGTRAYVAGSGGEDCAVFLAAPDGCDFIVRAYDIRNGKLLWEHHQPGPAPLEVAQSVTAEGEQAFAVGFGANDCEGSLPTNCDALVKAFDAATSDILWTDQIDSVGTLDLAQAVVLHDGRLFVVGYSLNDPTIFSADIIVRAYDLD